MKFHNYLLIVAALLSFNAHAATDRETPVGGIPLQYFGLHINHADAKTVWPSILFGSWRLWDSHVAWPNLEPERGKWDFSRLDKYVAMAKENGVEILLPLGLSPAWASLHPNEKSSYSPGNAAEPRDFADWRTYVRTVAERYKGKIRFYEIWNEPNSRDFYTGSIESLVELTREANNIIKEIDPTAKVISPAMTGPGRNIAFLDEFLSKGGKDCIDVVAYHFYVSMKSPEAMVPLIREVRAVMKKNGIAQKPLWNTETGWWIANGDGTPDNPLVANGGWKKVSLEASGDYILRSFLVARAEGVDRFFWYSWDNRYGLGMIEPTSGKPKPMVEKWRSTVDRLLGATQLSCAHDTNIWRCSFVRRDGIADQVSWIGE